jgi:hypothetical protein
MDMVAEENEEKPMASTVEQLARVEANAGRESLHGPKGQVSFSAFDAAEVGPVHSEADSEGLL